MSARRIGAGATAPMGWGAEGPPFGAPLMGGLTWEVLDPMGRGGPMAYIEG